MAVPAMTQRNAGSAKAGEEAGAEAEPGAARPKGMVSIVKGPVWMQGGLAVAEGEGRPSQICARMGWRVAVWGMCDGKCRE